jgi:phosphatidylglycerophosphate synthase
MLDRSALALLKPALDALARRLVRAGIGADTITCAAFVLGVGAALAIALGAPLLALLPLLASRLLDGLDGAVARLTRPTDRGAFLDIALDMLFYASVPLAFAVADPPNNALPAALLLAAFIGTASSFLAFAVFAQKRGLANAALPDKGFYFLGGLTEGTETLLCFVLMCLWPAQFAWWASGFALLCGLTIASRIIAGWRLLSG